MADEPDRLIQSHGRRRGRRLRPGQRALLRDLLPRVAIDAAGGRLDVARLFARDVREVWLEIGFGAGEHLASQAACHPDVGFIGAEPYVNGMAALLAKIRAGSLDNIRIWPADARSLLPLLPDRGLGRAFILFPDPWPKARHHKRRLIARPFLDELARVLAPGAEVRIATDDPGYLSWILERMTAHAAYRWLARAPADWRERPADWPATRYEEWASSEGRKPAYLRFRRQPANP